MSDDVILYWYHPNSGRLNNELDKTPVVETGDIVGVADITVGVAVGVPVLFVVHPDIKTMANSDTITAIIGTILCLMIVPSPNDSFFINQ